MFLTLHGVMGQWGEEVKKLRTRYALIAWPWLHFNLSPSPITYCLLSSCVSESDFSDRVQSCVKDMQLSQSAQLILSRAFKRQEITLKKEIV